MNIAALQLSSLPISESKLDYYLRICHAKGVEILVFGEYVLNLFFKELESMPREMVKEQSDRQLEILQEFSNSYKITFIAPVVRCNKSSIYKSIVKIKPDSKPLFYDQQLLIPFKHWDEKAFFSNKIQNPLKTPMIFSHGGFKFAVMFGYEMHFDELWVEIKNRKIDCVLMPSASTFGSINRWREIIKTRAFTSSCYVLRVNRIGDFIENKTLWKFYGDSLLCKPDGEIENSLMDKEELLVVNLDKETIKDIRKNWSFALSFK